MFTAGDGDSYFKCNAIEYVDEEEEIWDDGAGGQVKLIVVCHDTDKIRSIQVMYERQGDMLLSRRHGVNKGSVDVISFSEPLKWVRGRKTHNVVKSLEFGTEYETYGPFGCDSNVNEEDPPFHFKTSTWIGGFHGCSRGGSVRGCLSNIGVYIWCPAVRHLDGPSSPAAAKSAMPPRGWSRS